MEADELMDDDLFADLYGDDEPSKTAQVEQSKPVQAPASTPAPTAAAAQPAAPPTENNVPATSYAQEASPVPAVAQKAVDPRAPPPSQPTPINQQPVKIENPYAIEEEADTYSGWDAAMSGSNGNDNGAYGGYGYDGSGGVGGYGDGQVSGSPAIKEDGKMFIGGLNWETTDESLKEYFSQYGEVIECTVMRDGPTGRSRGFGFLTFKDPKTVNIVMVKEHYLDGKIIDPKRAIPRDEQEKTSKIFVGGVSQEASEADFREFFTQFGRVLDATLMMDKDTGRPRGFGFVTFDSEGAVENALNCKTLEILGKPIEVKKAQPRGNIRERMNANFDERDDHRGSGGGGSFRDRADRRDRFENRDGSTIGSSNYNNAGVPQNQPAQGGQQGIYGGIPPQVMAQYYQNVQRYMQAMQAMGRGAAGPMPIANPAIMQALGRGAAMNPAMMQQMQQMQQMQAQQGQQGPMGTIGSPGPPQSGPQGGYGSPQSQMGYGGPQGPQGQQQGGGNYDNNGASYHEMQQQAQQQQQHQQQQAQQQNQYRQQRNNFQHHPSQRDYQPPQPQPSSWEGMYDDVPPQQQMMQQGRIGMNCFPHFPGPVSSPPEVYHNDKENILSGPFGNSYNIPFTTSHAPYFSAFPNPNSQTHLPFTKSCEVDHGYSSPGGGGAPYRQNGQGSDGPPPNAPTGPRNAKGSGSNYRGGGRGATAARADGRGGAGYNAGYRGGYHPYARNG